MSAGVSRRWVLATAAAGAAQFTLLPKRARAALVDPPPMRSGDFAWFPERAPDGPLVIFASIPRQLVHVYRNGTLIGVSTCSTGKPGNSTPAGTFTVINKHKVHRSSKYGDPMPNTLRLTQRGVALHGGELPGYPASHGCVRLPFSFADSLFEETPFGTPVVIGGLPNHPLVHGSRIVPAASAGKVLVAREAARSVAPVGRDADTVLLVSAADRRIYVVQDGTLIAQGSVAIDDATEPLGTNVFVWRGGDVGGGSIWQGNGFEPVPRAAAVGDAAVLARLEVGTKIMGTVDTVMHPGVVLLTTDQPLNPPRAVRYRPRRTVHRKRKRRQYSRRSR